MAIEKFEDIISWQKGKELALLVYSSFKDCRDFSFVDQIKRASVSVTNNIAEGFERKSNAEFAKFLFIAKGSCGEVRSMATLAVELGYLSQDNSKRMCDLSLEISRLISGLVKALKASQT